ncbi:3-oxoacyl-ACP reductase FabG [Angustibacter speluncae]
MSVRDPFATLRGTTGVVTGSARGIGLEIARALREAGLVVVLADLDAAELEVAAADLGTGGERVVPVACDLTTEDGHAALDAALDGLPPLSSWVNNAGVVSHQLTQDVDQDTFERVLRTNAWAPLRGSRTAFAHMQHDGPRAVVNVTSLVLDKTVPERTTYAASKAALASLTRYAAADWGSHGIRVNAVAPGYIDTRLTAWAEDDPRYAAKQRSLAQIPLGRFGQPQDVAHAVLLLLSPLAAYVTGETLFVDGGWALT